MVQIQMHLGLDQAQMSGLGPSSDVSVDPASSCPIIGLALLIVGSASLLLIRSMHPQQPPSNARLLGL